MKNRENFSYIFIVRPGRENKVLKDLYDLLFPFDTSITHENLSFPSAIFIKTKISPEKMKLYLQEYPVRHIINVRYIIVEKKISDIFLEDIFHFNQKFSNIPLNICTCQTRFHGIRHEIKKKIEEKIKKHCKRHTKEKCFFDVFEDRLLISVKIFSIRKNTKI